ARARMAGGDHRRGRLARRLHEDPPRHAAEEGDLRLRRAGGLHRGLREGAADEEDRGPAARVGGEEAEGQGLRAQRGPVVRLWRRRSGRPTFAGAHRLPDRGAQAHRGGDRPLIRLRRGEGPLVLLLLLAYGWLFVFFERLNNPNELVRVYAARSL